MKKILLSACLLVFAFFSHSQVLQKIKERAKQKAESKTLEKVDKTVDTAFNKTERKVDETVKSKAGDKTRKDSSAMDDNSSGTTTSIKAYSKYDFVPGEKIIGFEDFSTGNIGDFPAGWNTNASAEIVTIEGKPGRWLWFTKPGHFAPELAQQYPEDFTFEFDLLHGIPFNGGNFYISFAELDNSGNLGGWQTAINSFGITLENANTGTETGLSRFAGRKNGNTDIQNSANSNILNDKNNPVHIAIWRQKERVRVYINEEKLWDIPKATSKEAKFNSIIFSVPSAEEVVKHFIGNLRLAVGAPDTRKKILEQNKWVTHGILFDVNSANIKPQSYGTLKEMANVLKEYPDLKVNIVGHTDADGKDDANLDLSKRRAASVKAMLAKEFGIDESRMETDGKGESEPIDKNDNPAGKANNRRVEFIKI